MQESMHEQPLFCESRRQMERLIQNIIQASSDSEGSTHI